MRTVLIILTLTTLAIAEQIIDDKSDSTDVEGRKKYKYHHGLWHWWGFHGLAILYWIKVKVIIVAFIIGTAIVWAARAFWYHKSCPEVVHGGPAISYDHGLHDHADHVPFSSYSDVFHGHDPYGGYSSYSDTQPDFIDSIKSHPDRKNWKGRQATLTEDQISDMVFIFLGVGSEACRKRFLCELEFKSQGHPLTRMAFKIVGHGIFSKYVRNANDEKEPKTFQECAEVHNECQVIEEHIKDEELESDYSDNITKKPEEDISSFTSVNTNRRKLKSRRKTLRYAPT